MLPKSFQLNRLGSSLPSGSNIKTVTCRPVTGITFTAQQVIDVDLPATGWLDGSSLSFRYKVAYTGGALNTPTVLIGTPLYTPFQRLQITQGGTVIDSIGNYSQVANMLTNLELGISQKLGLCDSYGYNPYSLGNTQYLDGRLLGTTIPPTVLPGANVVDTFYVSGPIHCLFNQTKTNIPLFAADPIRFTFTLDSLVNMSYAGNVGAAAGQVIAGMVISNFEVVATIYDLGKDIERITLAQGPLYLKSASFNNSSLLVNSGAAGSNSYFFNQRYSSIRSLFLTPCQIVGSKVCESCDITSGSGDYSFQLNGQQYPPFPLSSTLNDSGILTSCLNAARTIYPNPTMCIDKQEYESVINTVPSLYYEPGKFFPSISLMKCKYEDDVLMTGVSSKETGINAVISIPTATTASCVLGLIIYFDLVMVFDPNTKKISVRN
jgi:hypothetical protein